METAGKKITVLGAVRSGVGAARLLKRIGALPFVSDAAPEEKIAESICQLKGEGIPYETGRHTDAVYDASFIVTSPGVPNNAPVLKKARELNIPVISELQLAASFCKGTIIGITGTNGKTTTTSLMGHVLRECGQKTYIAGNIGIAFSDIALDVHEEEFVSLEISSFQLDWVDTFAPRVSMILNITPDHLNRYENQFEKYVASKYRIFASQKEGDLLIVNADDKTMRQFPINPPCMTRAFSLRTPQESGCHLEGKEIVYRENGVEVYRFDGAQMQIRGEHNLANTMPVIITSFYFGLSKDRLTEALLSFPGVEHRIELVRVVKGVQYVNDSKGTNVDAVYVALRSFHEPLYLILGGQDKGNDYSILKDLVIQKAKKVYAIGSSADTVETYFSPFVSVERKDSLEACVHSAAAEACAGDVVMLSPACASFDMFDNYEHRGRIFKQAVLELPG